MEIPFDERRLDAVLRNADNLRAAMPTGAAVDAALWSDAERLLWLDGFLPLKEHLPTDEWLGRAHASRDEHVAFYRAWPTGLGMGGPAREAERVARIDDNELRILAARLPDIAAWLAVMQYREPRSPETMQQADKEARKWLTMKTVTTSLAGNWFGDAADALEFVEKLYTAGAVKVVIAADSIQEEGPKERHADAIRVKLPKQADQRANIIALINKESENEGTDPIVDTGQDLIFVWWD